MIPRATHRMTPVVIPGMLQGKTQNVDFSVVLQGVEALDGPSLPFEHPKCQVFIGCIGIGPLATLPRDPQH